MRSVLLGLGIIVLANLSLASTSNKYIQDKQLAWVGTQQHSDFAKTNNQNSEEEWTISKNANSLKVSTVNQADTRGERMTRLIIYTICYGLFIELAIFFAKFNRSNESHDEFHAALMLLAFAGGLVVDLWFLFRERSRLFTGMWELDTFFWLICAVNVYALPQLGNLVLTKALGNSTRVKMRMKKDGNGYLKIRKLHKWSGILLYLITKTKLFFITRIEDHDQIIWPTSESGLQIIFMIYIGVLVLVWMFVVAMYTVGASRFRNKTVPQDNTVFDTAEKGMHFKLLDLKSDQTLDGDLSEIFKDLIWVMFEDRVFDVTNLDHPGGRFIIATLCGKEVSRYMVGGEEYTGTISSSYVRNKHSPFALNMLEER